MPKRGKELFLLAIALSVDSSIKINPKQGLRRDDEERLNIDQI
jgi:hypothetical protein